MEMARNRVSVRPFDSGQRGARDENGERRNVQAQLSVTSESLARLLSVSGSQSDFVLASSDGGTSVKVGLAVSAVPDALLRLGKSGVVLDWSKSTLSHGE